ncbi:MAG: hypothetical protein LUO93_06405 [Methanomicrobiales archaeon]|nr:hypothetical protein [Methanomicrobiales archaeon]
MKERGNIAPSNLLTIMAYMSGIQQYGSFFKLSTDELIDFHHTIESELLNRLLHERRIGTLVAKPSASLTPLDQPLSGKKVRRGKGRRKPVSKAQLDAELNEMQLEREQWLREQALKEYYAHRAEEQRNDMLSAMMQ